MKNVFSVFFFYKIVPRLVKFQNFDKFCKENQENGIGKFIVEFPECPLLTLKYNSINSIELSNHSIG